MIRRSFCIIFYILIISSLTISLSGSVPDTLKTKKSIKITGVGDIMLGSSYPSAAYLPPRDNALALLGNLADTLATSDITFGNLEGSFLNSGTPVKTCRDTTLCYLFRMPERYAPVLSAAGFDIINLANNHFGDFGYPAYRRTVKLLDSLGINYAGLTNHPYSIFRKGSLTYGFCGFSPCAGTPDINDIKGAERLVRFLADTCDIVIVSFHGGAEGSDYQHVPRKSEIFYGEQRGDVYDFAHRMIDAGADIIFGHGPHVMRAIEIYRDRFIAYSLGNFCTYGKFNILGPNGIAPVMTISVDSTGKFLSGKIIPVCQTMATPGVRIDGSRRAVKKLQELVSADFPDAAIKISDDGNINYR